MIQVCCCFPGARQRPCAHLITALHSPLLLFQDPGPAESCLRRSPPVAQAKAHQQHRAPHQAAPRPEGPRPPRRRPGGVPSGLEACDRDMPKLGSFNTLTSVAHKRAQKGIVRMLPPAFTTRLDKGLSPAGLITATRQNPCSHD